MSQIKQYIRYIKLRNEIYGKCSKISYCKNLTFEQENTKRSVREATLCKMCYFPLLHWWGEKINLGGSFFFGVRNFRTFTVPVFLWKSDSSSLNAAVVSFIIWTVLFRLSLKKASKIPADFQLCRNEAEVKTWSKKAVMPDLPTLYLQSHFGL